MVNARSCVEFSLPEMQTIAFDVAVTIRITKREYSGEMMSRRKNHEEDEDESRRKKKIEKKKRKFV